MTQAPRMDGGRATSWHPCSPAQSGIVFASLAGRPGVYVQQVVVTLREPVDAARLDAAWQATVARHEALRASFDVEASDTPSQRVHDDLAVPFVVEDLQSLEAGGREARWQDLLAADRAAGFDPGAAPLLRLALCRFGDGEARLLWTYHHAILDGRSRLIVLREAFARYDAPGGDTPLPDAEPFRPFAEWASARRSDDDTRRFWERALEGVTAGTPAPVVGGTAAGAVVPGSAGRRLDVMLSDRLRSVAQRRHLTLATILQGAFALLLAQGGGDEDVVFATTRAGRRSPPFPAGDVVGVVMAVSPVRVRVDPSAEVHEWLRGVRDWSVAVRPHEHAALADVQRWSGVAPGRSLAEILFSYENETMEAALRGLEDTAWRERGVELHERLDYGLGFSAYGDREILLKAHHDGERVTRAGAELLLRRYEDLLREIARDDGARVGDLGLLGDGERRRLAGEGVDVAPPTAQDMAPVLFRRRALEQPGDVALQCGDERLTYAQLDARAQAVAARLRDAGAGAETRVGIAMRRTPDMVAALLGVQRAGAAYVPLDPRYPAPRLRFMLADSATSIVLTDRASAAMLPADEGLELILVEDVAAAGADELAELEAPAPSQLSHVVYTSGSTGRPKGVMIEHGALAQLVRWARETFSGEERDGVLAATSLSFDLSVFELLATLALGGRVVLVDDVLAVTELRGEDVALVNAVPSALAEVLRAGGLPASVRTVTLGGEAVPRTLVERLHALPGVDAVWNLYGPSEDTTYSTQALCDPALPGPPPIGRPLPGTQAYVLDATLRPVAVGVPGELFLGGAGLARGYHDRPDLTAERFVANPFEDGPSARLYRTGDRACWRPDSQLEFLGRLDDQVKIRGHRIEPGEVRQALLEHAGVADAAVVARGDGADRRLVAYVVPAPGPPPAPQTLRADLAGRLPSHLVPGAVVALDALPLTPNGKLDHAALPAPAAQPGSAAVASATERGLAEIWREMLALDALPGPADDFFALGGHSLLALRLLTRIEERFGERPPLGALFAATTLRELAAVVESERRRGDRSPLIGVRPSGSRPPWFCVMTDHRGVIGLRNVLPAVLTDQPVFALQAIDPRNPSWRTSSVEEIATTCLAAIREQRPAGPYRLGGYSLGGLVAYEMACRLEEAGEEVDLLVLMDTLAPEAFSLRGRVAGRQRVTKGATPTWQVRSWKQFFDGQYLRWRALRSGGHEQRTWVRARGFDDPYDHAGATRISRAFRPRPFGGRTVVFHTAESLRLMGSELLGWEVHLRGAAEPVLVPGPHVGILATEHVEGFSRALAVVLEGGR